jgi:hypothetical protein
MPRRRSSLPTAAPGDAPPEAPKKRNRPTVRKSASRNPSKPARKRTKTKTKPSQQIRISLLRLPAPVRVPPLALLPAPLHVPLLTYTGESQQITFVATTIDLLHPIDGPTTPQPIGATHQDDPELAGAHAAAQPRIDCALTALSQ